MQANMLEHAILSRSTRWRAPAAVRLIYSPIKYPRFVRNRLKSSKIYVKHKKLSHSMIYMSVPSIPTHQPVPSPIAQNHTTTRQPDPPSPIPGNSPCINCARAKGRHIVFSQTRTATQQRSPHLRKRGISITATWPTSLARCRLTSNARSPIPHAAYRLAATMSSLGTRGHAAGSLKYQTP